MQKVGKCRSWSGLSSLLGYCGIGGRADIGKAGEVLVEPVLPAGGGGGVNCNVAEWRVQSLLDLIALGLGHVGEPLLLDRKALIAGKQVTSFEQRELWAGFVGKSIEGALKQVPCRAKVLKVGQV